MSAFLKLLFSLSLSGAIAVAVLLLLQKLFYKKVSKCWRYYAWLIVFVRLILPLTPANSPIGNLFTEKEVSSAVSDVTVPAQSPVTVQMPAQTDSAQAPQADFAAPTPHDSSPVVSIPVVLAAIWGVVALMLFTRRLTQYQSFRQYLRAGSIPVADPALLDRYALMCERANISRVPPDLLVNPLITTPMLVGLCKPLIILPDTPADGELESILLHELMHFKRGDAVYKWFAQLVLCLHWFNPAAWIAVRAMERDCEFACDEAVLNLLPPQQHRGYGNALLQAVQPRNAYPCKIARLALGEDAKRLKERLEMIMDYRRRTRLEQGLAIVLTLTLCAGSVAVGAYAADAKGSSTPSAQAQSSSTSTTVKEDASTPQGTLELAMQAVQLLDIDALCRYSNNKKSTMNTIYSDSNHYNDKTKGPILFGGAFAASDTMNKELVRMLSWKIGKVSVSGDVATAELQITNRDFGDVIATIISNSLLESASGTSSEDFENDDMDLLVKAVPDSKTVTLTVTANLYKSNNQWRLYLNGKFANAVCGNLMDGVDSPASKAKVDAASKKLEESIEKSMDWEGMQKEVQEEVEAAMREREEALKELESSLNEMEASLNAEKPFLYFRF